MRIRDWISDVCSSDLYVIAFTTPFARSLSKGRSSSATGERENGPSTSSGQTEREGFQFGACCSRRMPVMDYISTRGSAPTLDFRAATLAGLASDGGLYVPAKWPQMSADDIRALAGLAYVETEVRVLAAFVAGALREDELRGQCPAAYGRFNHAAVTPPLRLVHSPRLPH